MVQVADQVKACISSLLLDGSVKDARLDGLMVTVTGVEMSPDLKYAKVFVSTFSTEEQEVDAPPPAEETDAPALALEGLRSARSMLQREIAQRLALRFTPRLQFSHDESIAYGARMEALLREVAPEAEDEED
jgi:ribosome-binding factor A